MRAARTLVVPLSLILLLGAACGDDDEDAAVLADGTGDTGGETAGTEDPGDTGTDDGEAKFPTEPVSCEDDSACAEWSWYCDPLQGLCVPCLFDSHCDGDF